MWVAAAAVSIGLMVSGAMSGAAASETAKVEPGPLALRFLGPADGNRVAAIVGVPGDGKTYYAGAASGGIWKSVDGGAKWLPIFDNQQVAAIGALAVAASDPNVVWAGTGEAWAIRDADVGGDGVYRSDDAGKTWTHVGLETTGRIGRIVVDPRDPKTAYVCALGRMTAPQETRGVYKTTDGGKSWTRSLFVDERTGCSGLAMDPNDPKTLFAGTWQVEMHTWAEMGGGPGSGLYVSHDAGASWTHLEGHGLPVSPLGKIDVAVAQTDGKRVYALIQTAGQGSVWRSDDGGSSWAVTSWERNLTGRAGYYIRLVVSPADKDKVYVASSAFHVSTDGGKTFPETRWGGDNHDIWIDPTNANRFAIAFDGGLGITTVGGEGMTYQTLPIGQMYHVAVDDQIPYDVYGNMQDNGTMRLPSLGGGMFGPVEHGLGGCESGFTLPDPANPDIVWATCYGDEVTRWDATTRRARSVSPWLHTLDSAPDQVKYRCHWTPPLAIDPFDHETVYYGCQVMFRTTDKGATWKVISPDLSTRDPSRIIASGGLVGDNLGQFYGEVIFAIAPSTRQKGLIWAGTNDGKVWLTRDGGDAWTDLTANLAGLPAWGTVTSIQPSFFDPATAYLSVDAHLVDDRNAYIFKTTDFGASWTRIDASLPRSEFSYVKTVSEDPNARGLLFAGTGNALYYSPDEGAHWKPLKDGLPPSPVTWTVVQPRFHDLVVSTYGRGFYILDDISPLEAEATKAQPRAQVALLPIRPTWRLGRGEQVIINFTLKDAAKDATGDSVKLEILDPEGHVIRTLAGAGRSGLNRMKWDLRYEDLKTVILRTTPPENPHIWDDPRFKGKTSRPVFHWGMSPHQRGPMAIAGSYIARLTAGGQTVLAPFELRTDPKAQASAEDLKFALDLQLRVAADIETVAARVNLLEQMRHQLEEAQIKASPAGRIAIAEADERLKAVEYEMFSKALAPSDDKYFVSAYKTYFHLMWLRAEIGDGAGDVQGNANLRPTPTQVGLVAELEEEMKVSKAHYDALIQSLPALNKRLASLGLPALETVLRQPDAAELKARAEENAAADEDYAAS